jgi:hypothetical protein
MTRTSLQTINHTARTVASAYTCRCTSRLRHDKEYTYGLKRPHSELVDTSYPLLQVVFMSRECWIPDTRSTNLHAPKSRYVFHTNHYINKQLLRKECTLG